MTRIEIATWVMWIATAVNLVGIIYGIRDYRKVKEALRVLEKMRKEYEART